MPSLNGIPIDVGAHIVDFLAQDENGHQHVKACALVCRAFLPLCRKHIFRSVTINQPLSVSPRLHHARALFAANPMLSQCVQKLDFCILPQDFISPYFVPTLNYFTNLQSLSLWYHGIDKLDWQLLPRHVHRTFLRLLHLPTLNSLRLRNITNVTVSDLVLCAALSHLAIEQVEPLILDGSGTTYHQSRNPTHDGPLAYISKSNHGRHPHPRPPSVNTVHLQRYSSGLRSAAWTNAVLQATNRMGAPIFDFTGLRHLSAKCDDEHDLAAARRLLARAEDLESIHLKISEVLSLRGLARSMHPCAVQRTLRRASFAMYINDESEDPLLGLCEELEDIRARGQEAGSDWTMNGNWGVPHASGGRNGIARIYNGSRNRTGNVLEMLSIHVMVLPDAGCKRGHEWGKLNAVLGRPGWNALRRVSLQVTIWDFMRISSDMLKYTLEMLLDTQFVGLSRNPDIEFQFNVDVKELTSMQE